MLVPLDEAILRRPTAVSVSILVYSCMSPLPLLNGGPTRQQRQQSGKRFA
jgi:hypothetical protein